MRVPPGTVQSTGIRDTVLRWIKRRTDKRRTDMARLLAERAGFRASF
jgi:hypothetical protein